MQAILTKYHGPTNTRGSRTSAQATAGRVSTPWDSALDVEANHQLAARALIATLGWTTDKGHTDVVGGCLPSGDYAWVFLPKVVA